MAAVGDRIGHFRLLEQIGAGGMGVVFRARDERVGRDVALKLIPPAMLSDETARKRFHQEARALSRVSHPNIATLFEFDTYQGQEYLVMELVTGTSLRRRLEQGRLSAQEFHAIATQMVAGLAAAHEAGIVHRDLKPENIILAATGQLKILDFGVAKFTPAALATAATTHTVLSEVGVVGTVPYMAPEQLRGDETDPRSDIYSAGVVLYEMASGRLPFQGNGVLLIDAILNAAPIAPSAVNRQAPQQYDSVVIRALDKNPQRRYQSAQELAVDLERLGTSTVPMPAPGASKRRLWLTSFAIALAGVLAIAVAGVIVKRELSGPNHAEFVQLTHFTDAAVTPAISADGRMIAYLRGSATLGTSGQRGTNLWVQMLPGGQPTRLTNDDRNKNWPMFSPDGSRIAYTTVGSHFAWDTWEVQSLGGASRQLLPNASGLSWIGDRYLYSKIIPGEGTHMGVAVSSASRADERMIYVPPMENGMAHRSLPSPKGDWLLIVEMDNDGIWMPCRLMPFDGLTKGRPVGPANSQCTAAGWSPDGKWMYLTCSVGGVFHLWRQRFPDGEPEQITNGATEEEGVAMAADGKSLLTAAGTRLSTIWFHDKKGNRQVTSEGFSILPTLAPDRKAVYYLVQSGGTSRNYIAGELWRTDLETGHAEAVLPGVAVNHYALSRDARRVLYATNSTPPGLWLADLDRGTPPRQLTRDGSLRGFFGADGTIVYLSGSGDRLVAMNEDGSGARTIAEHVIHFQSISSNGEWAVVNVPASGGGNTSVVAYPIRGGPPVVVCAACLNGFGPYRTWAPLMLWDPEGKFVYIPTRWFERAERTAVVPTNGAPIQLDPKNPPSEEDLKKRYGARFIEERDLFPGPDPDTYVFTRYTALTNIYRVILPR